MFDGAVVAIEAAQPPVAAYVAAAVRGCSSALGPGRCVEADLAPDPRPPWRAILRAYPETDPRVMQIEVEHEGTAFGRRQLQFTERDAVETRWSTAGVVVAAIISGELEGAAAPPPSGDSGPETTTAPPPAVAPPVLIPAEPIDLVDEVDLEGPPLFRLEGSALEGLALGGAEVYEAAPEFGVLLRAKLAMLGGPFLLTAVGGSATPHNPVITQVDGFVGLGAPIEFSDRFALDVVASFVGEWLWLRHETASGRADSRSQGRLGGAADLDLRVRVSGCWSTLVGAHATVLWPEVDVRRPLGEVQRQVAVVLPAGLGATLGVRYDLGYDCR